MNRKEQSYYYWYIYQRILSQNKTNTFRSEEARKEAMGAIYEHVAGQEPPQKNIALRAISAHYPNFTPLYDSQVPLGLCHQGLHNHQPYLTQAWGNICLHRVVTDNGNCWSCVLLSLCAFGMGT